MLKTWWKIIKTAVWVVGGLLSFFFLVEILRAYQTLYNFHRVAAYGFVVALVAVTIWVFWYFFAALASRPPVLTAPRIGDPGEASTRRLRRYAKYLVKYVNHLSRNQVLSSEDRERAADNSKTLAKACERLGHREELLNAVLQAEESTVQPLLEKIDALAKRQVRTSMRDVMIGVTLSPYKAADLLIVLYRNLVMVSRIVRVYNARPRFRQQLKIYSDIVSVIATVNFINMGKNLIEGLGSRVPGIGRFIDDIAQGMGAGFMTTVVGHAAMDRCRAYRPWNEQEAKDSLRKRAADFYADVKDTFWVDIWPSITSRVGEASAELKDKIASALDETGNAVGSFVKVPLSAAVSAGTTVVSVGGKAALFSFKGITKVTKIFRPKRTKDKT